PRPSGSARVSKWSVRPRLCDHSQISHVINDVILFTTIHVITDWPVTDHMIGTSHRGPVQHH
ncbi:unnamed protein product, partial [Staurois parvus]